MLSDKFPCSRILYSQSVLTISYHLKTNRIIIIINKYDKVKYLWDKIGNIMQNKGVS